MDKTIIVSCTWGEGPDDVMVEFRNHDFILYENPRHNMPPQGDYKHRFVTKGSYDLTEKEARNFGNALIQAADKAQEYEKTVIREEIEDGKRPIHWDDPTHTDYTVWQNWLQKNPEIGLV